MSLSERKTIVVDIDGVIVDLETHFLSEFNKINGWTPERISDEYYFGCRYDIREQEAMDILHMMDWSNAPVYQDAVDAMRILKDAGFHIVLCTAVDERHIPARIKNMEQHGICFDEIISSGFHGNKEEVTRAYNPMAIVDDLYKHLNEFDDVKRKYLVDRGYTNQEPWNCAGHISVVSGILSAAQSIIDMEENATLSM